jgi:hypothetical protein
VAVDAAADGDAGVSGCGGEGLDRDAGLGGTSLRPRWRYSFLAYLGRLMATRGMNRSSTIARIRSGGIGL